VTTCEPTVLLSLSRENLENFDEMDPTIYTVILKNLAKNLSSRIRVVDDAFAVVLFSSQEREQVETAN
jgi:CRP-like cAMP-binding protein